MFHTMLRQGKAVDALAALRGAYHYVTSPEEEAKIAAADDVPAPTPEAEEERNLKKVMMG